MFALVNISPLLTTCFILVGFICTKNKFYWLLLIKLAFFSFVLALLSQVLSPGTFMSKEEFLNLPCKGMIAEEFKKAYEFYPEYNESCKSVIHVGHGNQKYGVHSIFNNSIKLKTEDVIKSYPQKKQYVFSCRGETTPLKSIIKGKVSFIMGEREKEIIDGKEVIFFAKKGNLLLSLTRMAPWFTF